MSQREPAYKKIFDSIRNQILLEQFQSGDMLPSENEIEKSFQVSRTPVREALKQLENQGYIYRLQGKGSFVANRKPQETWTLMTGFQSHYQKDWEKMSAKTIDMQKVIHPQHARTLEADMDAELTYLSRIRYVNGDPLVYLEYYIRPIVSFETFEENTTFLSVEQVITDASGIQFVDIEEVIEAVTAEPYIAGVLHIPLMTPLLKITRISYCKDRNPVLINIYYSTTTMNKYYVSYKRTVQE